MMIVTDERKMSRANAESHNGISTHNSFCPFWGDDASLGRGNARFALSGQEREKVYDKFGDSTRENALVFEFVGSRVYCSTGFLVSVP